MRFHDDKLFFLEEILCNCSFLQGSRSRDVCSISYGNCVRVTGFDSVTKK